MAYSLLMSVKELVTVEEIDSYRRDGVVCLRRRFENGWIELLTDGIEANFRDPSPLFADNPSPDGKGHYYEYPPDIDNHPEDYEIVSFDMEPGDCLLFDLRTVHGFPKDVLPERTVRRFTLRMAAEDGVFRHRGDWAKRERQVIEAAGHRNGDALCSEFFATL